MITWLIVATVFSAEVLVKEIVAASLQNVVHFSVSFKELLPERFVDFRTCWLDFFEEFVSQDVFDGESRGGRMSDHFLEKVLEIRACWHLFVDFPKVFGAL